jgi:hypothetical protein
VATLTVRELFEFVVDPALTDQGLDAELDRLMEMASRWVKGAGRVWGGEGGLAGREDGWQGPMEAVQPGSASSDRCTVPVPHTPLTSLL